MSGERRVPTYVYVVELPERSVPRWVVRVCYPGSVPVSLVSTPDHDEALKMARTYAARYNWTLLHDADDES